MGQEAWFWIAVIFIPWAWGSLLMPWCARFSKKPVDRGTLIAASLMWPLFGVLLLLEIVPSWYWRLATGGRTE